MKKSNKNIIYNQELIIEDKAIKIKTFNYFYHIITEKSQISIIALYFLHILELFQFISYAFTALHLKSWKLSNKGEGIIYIATNIFRIYPICIFIPSKINIIICIILLIFNIAFSIFMAVQII